MARGRKPLVLDKAEFQKVVSDLEGSRSFNTQGELWEAVCATEWAKTREPRPLTSQVAYMRAKEMGIVVNTQRAKAFGGKRNGFGGGSHRRSFASKVVPESVAKVRRRFPLTLAKTVDKMEQGSLKAAIKLNCMECSGFDKSEVKNCGIVGCPLYSFRPYKNVKKEGVVV